MTVSEHSLILSFADYRQQAQALARHCGLAYEDIDLHRFPDGESRLILPTQLPESVVICRSLNDPDHKLIELLLTARSAREAGVKRLILIAPYLCYMRQDKAFHSGEVVSQTIIGQFLADLFDVVITVDAHLHRIDRLSQAIPIDHAINLTATKPMATFINQQLDRPMLVGPDSESAQWVKAIAEANGLDYVVATKTRLGDADVVIDLPPADYAGREILLVDDVASTGKTLQVIARDLHQRQVHSIDVLVTHALFAGEACLQLKDAGIRHIWSCDSIAHASNKISLSPLFSESLEPFVNTR